MDSYGSERPADRTVPALSGERPPRGETCCKVERTARAHSLVGVDDELRRRHEAGATLHELAAYLNDRVTAVTLEAADASFDLEPATVRAALQDEESVPVTTRDDVRAGLAGVLDVELLVDSYVSHETVRKHLNEHLDISTSRGGFETVAELREMLDSYEATYERAVSGSLERAVDRGLLDGGSFRVFSTRVECTACSRTHRLGELVDSGGCDCRRSGHSRAADESDDRNY